MQIIVFGGCKSNPVANFGYITHEYGLISSILIAKCLLTALDGSCRLLSVLVGK